MAKRTFEGKRVLLTGASSGIGWYLASELVRAGAYVVVTSRRKERLQQLRLSFGNPRKRLIAVPGDVADAGHRTLLIETAVKELGGIDLVFNNAGIGAVGPFETASPDRLRRIFEVDFFAVTELTRLALPHLHRGVDPAVCIVSSVLAHRGMPNKSEYCAAKFALRGWAESLRLELKPEKIDVVTVSPSTTSTEFFDSLLDSDPRERTMRFGVQSAERVARSIMVAVKKGKRDLILSPAGKALVWLSRLAPGLVDNLIMEFGR
jgi:short-subunit dehydrogenase